MTIGTEPVVEKPETHYPASSVAYWCAAAWCAGLFEGEGYVGVVNRKAPNGKRYPQVRMSLFSTDEDVVRTFHDRVNVGHVYESRPSPTQTRKVGWVWFCAKQADVRRLLELLEPMLGSRRRSKALEALEVLRR